MSAHICINLDLHILFQADIVRETKTSKADKAVIDTQIEKLLQLKRQLAIAQGKNLDAATGGKKKKKEKAEA